MDFASFLARIFSFIMCFVIRFLMLFYMCLLGLLVDVAATCLTELTRRGGEWRQSDAPARAWKGVASDSSGKYQIAAASDSALFLSQNYGRNWTSSASPSLAWSVVTSDSTGRFLVAGTVLQGIYWSDDVGTTWKAARSTDGLLNFHWYSISSSADGKYVVATVNDAAAGGIYYSHDFGQSWLLGSAQSSGWTSVAMDRSGHIAYAVSFSVGVYKSGNYGRSWTRQRAVLQGSRFQSIATDRTGQRVVAASARANNSLWYFSDGMNSWLSSEIPFTAQWPVVSMDSSGTYVYAAAKIPEAIIMSTDGGACFYSTHSPVRTWRALHVDSTGQHVTAAEESGRIYTMENNLPTSMPTLQPSSRQARRLLESPTSQPTGNPSAKPWGFPSTRPLMSPSAQPSSQPTAHPSGQPSSYPTVPVNAYEAVVSVTSLTPSYTSELTRLGHRSRVYVTANLLLYYVSEDSGGFITITAGQPGATNAVTVSSSCAPQTACPSTAVLPSTLCALNIDVTEAITTESGGTLLLTASSDVLDINGVTPSLCIRHGQPGIYFELNYTVSTFRQPTQQPTAAPTVAPTNGFDITLNSKGLVTAGGAPFYVVAFAAAAYTALAVLLVRLHDSHEKLTPHSLLSVCFDLALRGYTLVSEVFFVVLLFQDHSETYSVMALVMIGTRLFNLAVACYFLRRVFPPGVDSVSPYNNLYDKEVLMNNAKLYSALLLLMSLDVSTFRYFPWVDTEFAYSTAGFPDLLSFQVCMSTKVVTSLVSLAVQSIVLGSLNESGINSKYTLALFLLYLAATIVMFTITCLSFGMQIRFLRHAAEEKPQESGANGGGELAFPSGNPLHDNQEQNGGLELGAARTQQASRGSAAGSFWWRRSTSASSTSTAGGGDGAASGVRGRRRLESRVHETVPLLEAKVVQLTHEVQELRTKLQTALAQADAQQMQVRDLLERQAVMEVSTEAATIP